MASQDDYLTSRIYNREVFLDSLEYTGRCCDWLSQDEGDADRLSDVLDIKSVEIMITRLTALACALRTVQNRRVAVNRLPPEILGCVFDETVEHFKPLMSLPGFRVVTHPASHSIVTVCRYWRRIALGIPALWSSISLSANANKDDFFRISLQRSVLAPLTVHCDARNRPLLRRSSLFVDVMSEMSRIQDLRLLHRGRLQDLPAIFSDAPKLRTLAIQIMPETSEMGVTHFDAWQTPCVENLMVQGFNVWLNHTWSGLRCLCVSDQFLPSVKLVKQFLDVLVSVSSTIGELVLSQVQVPYRLAGLLSSYRKDLDLPRLRRLVIESRTKELLRLLSPRLILPPTCSQQLYTEYKMDYSDIVHRSSCYTPERLFIAGKHRVGVRGSSAFYMHHHVFKHLEGPAAPIADVKELWMSEGFLWTDEPESSWISVFNRMKSLRKLVFMDKFTVREYKANFMGNAFPVLEEVHIHQCIHLNDLDEIYRCLQSRRDAGWTIPQLIVYLGPKDDRGSNVIEDNWRDWARGPAIDIPVEVVFQPDTGYGPPQMTIPEICQMSSPLHDFWKPALWRGHFS